MGKFLELAPFEDFGHQASVGLSRGHVPDTRMVVLGIVPGKVALEISNGLYVIQKEGSNSGNPPHVPKPEKQLFL